VSTLYFVVLDLALVEPTYQWSLEFYINLFKKGIERTNPSREGRCENIIANFQLMLYESICRSLLEKDKLIFSLLIAIKLMEKSGKVTSLETRFLMIGGTWAHAPDKLPAEARGWLEEKAWLTLCEVDAKLKAFEGFCADFGQHLNDWQRFLSSDAREIKLPEPWNERLNSFL